MFEKYNDIVTVQQVAEMLQVGKNTAYKLVQEKRIRTIRCGRRYLIPKANVIAFLVQDSLQQDPASGIIVSSYGLVIDKEVVAQ